LIYSDPHELYADVAEVIPVSTAFAPADGSDVPYGELQSFNPCAHRRDAGSITHHVSIENVYDDFPRPLNVCPPGSGLRRQTATVLGAAPGSPANLRRKLGRSDDKRCTHVAPLQLAGANGGGGSGLLYESSVDDVVYGSQPYTGSPSACNADGVADGTSHQSCVTSVTGEGELIEVLRSKLVTGVIDEDEFAHMRSVMLRAEAETLA